jgi:hypothetical protein
MKQRIALAVVLLATLASAALAYKLHWETLQVPGASFTEIYTINNSNEMVGHYSEGVEQHGLAVIKGTPTNIDDPNGVEAFGGTWCAGVNSSGIIVGYYYNHAGGATGFIYDSSNPQSFSDITYPGATYTYTSSINDNGEIVGAYADSSGSGGGFLYAGGTFTTLPQPPNSTTSQAIGNNNAGLVTVQGENSNGNWSSYLYNPNNQSYTLINFPTAVNSYAEAINNRNSIVYAWEDSSGNFHGGVRSAAGKFLTLNEPNAGPAGTYTDGINDHNVIVGTFDFMNTNAGFVVTATK